MSEFMVRALGPDTWDGFAGLAQRHNGVFGGCWCTFFHTMHSEKTFDAEDNRSLKRRLVEEGRAHAALVYDGDEAVAWCEYGSPEELPNIYHRKQYEEELDLVPDYRITCIFVDRRYRRKGLSAVALQGALDLISEAAVASSRATRTTRKARRSPCSTTGRAPSSSGQASRSSAARARGTASCAAPCPDRDRRRVSRRGQGSRMVMDAAWADVTRRRGRWSSCSGLGLRTPGRT